MFLSPVNCVQQSAGIIIIQHYRGITKEFGTENCEEDVLTEFLGCTQQTAFSFFVYLPTLCQVNRLYTVHWKA
jgi:hypothetical protein